MDNSMPLSLIVAWVVFFGFVNTHQRHAMHFQGASQGYLLALQTSVILGSLVGLGLMVYKNSGLNTPPVRAGMKALFVPKAQEL